MAALQTVQKIGPVLDLFTIESPEWGVSAVADQLGVPRSTAHAMLSSLVETGLLQCRTRGRYRVGWRVVELNQTLNGCVDVRSTAAPSLQKLSSKFGETVHLAVMERYRVLYVDKVLGNHVINVSGARVGAHLEGHCSAVGKALLAHCDVAELERNIVNKPLRRLTPATITNPKSLLQELDSVRKNGSALDAGEAVSEVYCVAAPIRDHMGVVVAAISMTAPASRFVPAQRNYRSAVIAAAGEVSKALADASEAIEMPTVERDSPLLRAVPS